jgi:hypothetical protein
LSVRQWLPFAGVVLVLSAVGFAWGSNRSVTEEDLQSEVSASVGQAFVDKCENDLRFRKQARKRALAQQEFYLVEAAANEALIEVVNELRVAGNASPAIEALGEALDDANAALSEIGATIHIIPLPECDELREVVREANGDAP